MSEYLEFKLDNKFFNSTASWNSPFHNDPLASLVYYRTYSRNNENWRDTIKRVVEGTYHIQKKHIQEMGLEWNDATAQKSAQEMFTRIFNLKFCPPGRGLWVMGTDVVHKKNLAASLNNCAFQSTRNMDNGKPSDPFTFLADASMLGVGVGFDTLGAGKIMINEPKLPEQTFKVPDSREGWVKSMEYLLDSYFLEGKNKILFDYSDIRPQGTPLKTFGGLASGPQPLIDFHTKVKNILDKMVGKLINETTITDIANLIGKCVVSGNVRRTALIAFGSQEKEFLDLKNYEVNPERMDYGWTSNNSVFANIGDDYSKLVERIASNGEPGIAWLQNMKDYSRMGQLPDFKDHRAEGANPCVEQTLESKELCCLVECFPFRHDNKEDFLRTLKFAYLYAKTVTLTRTHWPDSNRVMLRNRRIGCSVSGIAQFISENGLHVLKEWLRDGYDTIQGWDIVYSDWFCIPRSIKTTSVKPSGTVSILAGATPGVHFPESVHYIRRVRISNTSHLIDILRKANYKLEPCFGDEQMTSVVEIPMKCEGKNMRSVADVSIWEQLHITAFMQEHWADNQVSSTITFNPQTEKKDIAYALNFMQYKLKAISFLPRIDYGAFPQMPYEAITEAQYNSMFSNILPCNFAHEIEEKVLTPIPGNKEEEQVQPHGIPSEQEDPHIPSSMWFCDGDTCTREIH